jgi:CHAT domain-containing protein
MPEASVLHLATHGYLQPEGWASLAEAAATASDEMREHPWDADLSAVARRLEGLQPGLLSGLVCAGVNSNLTEGRDDGYLTADEVGWLDLSGCEIAVLSACDTGLGRPQSGEGLLGLRRSFLLAGAKTVISSLWSVPDQSTAELMDLFYRNLWQRGMGRHESLRAAQLEMIEANKASGRGADPASWGAFVLDGDWR